jgi:hypothetical protein
MVISLIKASIAQSLIMNKIRKKKLLGNIRTPLPKKTEQIHKDNRKYNRKKKVSIGEHL